MAVWGDSGSSPAASVSLGRAERRRPMRDHILRTRESASGSSRLRCRRPGRNGARKDEEEPPVEDEEEYVEWDEGGAVGEASTATSLRQMSMRACFEAEREESWIGMESILLRDMAMPRV